MARIESVALGGFYKTPVHIVDLIAEMLDTETLYEVRMVDPCAGEGEAIERLATMMGVNGRLYLCELETKRYEALQRIKASQKDVLHGDAFQVQFGKPFAGVLYLNPPYDTDSVHGRLEEKFLKRFTQTLVIDGLLVFVVPNYALKASAETLASEYKDLTCYRFPDEDHAIYRQVVLFAHKTDSRRKPDPRIVAQVEAWAASADQMPVLGTATDKIKVTSGEYHPGDLWRMHQIDVLGLMGKVRPWRYTSKSGLAASPHILPSLPVADLLFRSYPVVTTPRPAHIASGIASGMFNGKRVSADTAGFPDLLVKGVFSREFETIRENENSKGEVVSVVQAQKPLLVTTIFNLETQKYSTLRTEGRSEGIETIEDLLHHYGTSLMQVMGEQCPVAYNPARDREKIPLVPVKRKLFTAQEDATRAIVMLLGGSFASRAQRRYKAAILLGEIGVGKTTCALTAAATVGRNVLVMCPPHLLTSWTNEVRSVLPQAEVRVLQTIADVHALDSVPAGKFLVAVLSREAGKLGHSWADVTGACPKCGATLPSGPLAKKRLRCSAQPLRFVDPLARAAYRSALKLAPYAPAEPCVRDLLQGRLLRRYLDQVAEPKEWPGFDPAWVARTMRAAKKRLANDSVARLFGKLLLANYDEQMIGDLVREFAKEYETDNLARDMTLLLRPGSTLQGELRTTEVFPKNYWYTFDNKAVEMSETHGIQLRFGKVLWQDGKLTLDGDAPGSLDLALSIQSLLNSVGVFDEGEKCGEVLFQAVPLPRRFALATYIAKHRPDFFEVFVADECHEYATDGSAQERSAHRISSLGIPTIWMTGSLMNGYAESLFVNMWSASADFREEFKRDERSRFVERYGYRERTVSERDTETREVVEYGSHTDRVERSERITGDAPGILPLFLFRHLLKVSVTLHKADLALELPKCHQIKHTIEPSAELMNGYKALLNSLKQQIKKDRFRAEYAGKLFGALAELPSYLDRATLDTGNQKDGSYEIRYPKSLDSELVVTAQSFDEETISAKERWMLDTVESELEEGRNVMILGWHVCLLPRLSRLVEQHLAVSAPVLYADKVPTAKRQDWIDKHIVGKNRRVMVVNPVCVQTGLNNLVHFASQIWMENPAANPTIVRQTGGRIDRIGQDKETRVHFPVYKGTLQEQLYDLLMKKVAVSTATDGLDPESVLLAAGASSSYLTGLSIGKQLWAMLKDD